MLDAAERGGDRPWLRSDEASFTFAEAAVAVGGRAEQLREHGVRRGDLVVLTARTTPDYLLAWFAVIALGAIVVATNPASAPTTSPT